MFRANLSAAPLVAASRRTPRSVAHRPPHPRPPPDMAILSAFRPTQVRPR